MLSDQQEQLHVLCGRPLGPADRRVQLEGPALQALLGSASRQVDGDELPLPAAVQASMLLQHGVLGLGPGLVAPACSLRLGISRDQVAQLKVAHAGLLLAAPDNLSDTPPR